MNLARELFAFGFVQMCEHQDVSLIGHSTQAFRYDLRGDLAIVWDQNGVPWSKSRGGCYVNGPFIRKYNLRRMYLHLESSGEVETAV